MMEAIANLVRAFPPTAPATASRSSPSSCDHEPGPSGELEWSLARPLRAALAVALDGALSAAYPDVRLGRRRGEPPAARAASSARPRARACASASSAASSTRCWPPATSSPRRRWRRSRTPRPSLGVPSVDPLQPHPRAGLLRGARAPASTAATRTGSSRQERWGLPEGGLTSTLNRAEMTNAERTQNRSLFWLEAVDRRRRPRDLPPARRRRPGPPRREPPAPPLDARPPEPLPPPLRHRHPAAAPLPARADLRRRGRAPARAADRAHEGRARPPRRDPADPDAARDPARRPRRRRPAPPDRRPAVAAPREVAA